MNIAIVGTGISGLTAAYLLSREHAVTVYEANDYVGGHTHTVDVPGPDGPHAVDTGFIVFNEKNLSELHRVDHPPGRGLAAFQHELQRGVPQNGLVFCPSTLNALFAQRKNIIRPFFYRMIADALRFRRASTALIKTEDDRLTLKAFLKKNHYSKAFTDYFIVPMGAAIWSADPRRFMDFPVRYLATFFHNHGF